MFGKMNSFTFLGCIFCLLVSLQHRPWCMSQSELALHSSPNWPDPGTGSWHMFSVHVYPTSQSVSYPHVSPDFFPHIGRHVPVTMEEIGTFAQLNPVLLLTTMIYINTGSSITTVFVPGTPSFVTWVFIWWILGYLRPITDHSCHSRTNQLALVIGVLVELASPTPDNWEATNQ